MTGPEHYAYAEQLLDMASDEKLGSKIERYHVRDAQVHATLALAAATVCTRYGEMPFPDAVAWVDAVATPIPADVTP